MRHLNLFIPYLSITAEVSLGVYSRLPSPRPPTTRFGRCASRASGVLDPDGPSSPRLDMPRGLRVAFETLFFFFCRATDINSVEPAEATMRPCQYYGSGRNVFEACCEEQQDFGQATKLMPAHQCRCYEELGPSLMVTLISHDTIQTGISRLILGASFPIHLAAQDGQGI